MGEDPADVESVRRLFLRTLLLTWGQTKAAMLCSFRLGRQEDAHEYLVSLLDAMHEAILAGIHPKPPREVAQTSFIYRIFGGTCRSQVGEAYCALAQSRAASH